MLGLTVDFHELLHELDEDGDELITEGELLEGYMRLYYNEQVNPTVGVARQCFLEVDKYATGELTRKQLQEGFSNPSVVMKLDRVGVKAEDFARFFNLVDEDGDGKLTMEEFTRTVETLKEVSAVTRALNMDAMDPNPVPAKDVKRGLTDPVTNLVERFDRRGTEPFELFRSEFGQNFRNP